MFLLCFFVKKEGWSQCPPFGTRANTAFLICGNVSHGLSDAESNNLGSCAASEVYVPLCTNASNKYLTDNPYWYKFTCYQGGTFGFMLTPNIPGDDYNWQLFDVTSQGSLEVYNVSNHTIAVACNWSGTSGNTGASASGTGLTFQCFSDPGDGRSPVSPMPTIVTGRNYVLLISRKTGSGGYNIQFGGGSAVTADGVMPALASVTTNCPGGPLSLKFTKKVNCATIDPFGSDFSISPPLASIAILNKLGCNVNTSTDSIIVELTNSLPPGNYTLNIETSTISDFCGNSIPAGSGIPFVIANVPPLLMDSITQPACSASELQLVFKTPVRCESVALNGSDFVITGAGPVGIVQATGYECSGGILTSRIIKLKLAAPLPVKGNYQVKLLKGTDNNTIMDECSRQIPTGTTLDFYSYGSVDAGFTYILHQGCTADTVDYFHDGRGDINSWKWDFGDGIVSSLQNPQILYNPFLGGTKKTKLIVSNAGCSDTSEVFIDMGPELKTAFEVDTTICPDQPAVFKNTTKGNVISWLWEFGNGNTSILEIPPVQHYPKPTTNTSVIAKLSATDNMGCTNTIAKTIWLPNNCEILVPTSFTPDGNGLNDYLSPVNINGASSYSFRIFNRYGITVFSTTDPSKKWDGNYQGKKAEPGVYVWFLRFMDAAGRIIDEKGTTLLLR